MAKPAKRQPVSQEATDNWVALLKVLERLDAKQKGREPGLWAREETMVDIDLDIQRRAS